MMEDQSHKKVEDVRKGDKVITFTKDHEISVGEIECVVKTHCDYNIEHMVTLGKLKITPYHPILIKGTKKWIFPHDIEESFLTFCSTIYTFILKNRESVIIEGYIFSTLGHGMEGNVIQHDFFGTEKVINDLKKWSTYDKGYVFLTKDMIVRDRETKHVTKIMKRIDYGDYVRNKHMANI
jgi:hypothetical protein